MPQLITGSFFVDSFVPTGNPGEYTFENGLFNNQNDTGNGAFDVVPGYVVFITPLNNNTGFPIAGVSQRYVFTVVTSSDGIHLTGTMLWDEPGEEVNPPSAGSFAIVSQTTPNHKLAAPLIDSNYADVTPGTTLTVLINDLINIMDSFGVAETSRTQVRILTVENDGQKLFTLDHVVIDKENTAITVNGLNYVYGSEADFIIEGNVVTWFEVSLILEPTDTVVIRYKY